MTRVAGGLALVIGAVAPLPPITDALDPMRGALLVATATLLIASASLQRGYSMWQGLAAVATVTALFAIAVATGADTAADPEPWLPWLLAPLLVTAWSLGTRDALRRHLVIAVGCVAVIAVAQQLGAPLFGAEHAPFGGRRAIGGFGNPTVAAIVFATALSATRDDGRRIEPVIAATLAMALVVSGSRAAWLAAICGIVVGGRAGALAHAKAITVGATAGVGITIGFGTHAATRLAASGSAVAGRVDTGRAALSALDPLTVLAGRGPGAFAREWPLIAATDPTLDARLHHAHFDLLELVWCIGVPLSGLMLAVLLRRVRIGVRDDGTSRAGAAALTALAVASLAQPVLFLVPTVAMAACAWVLTGPAPPGPEARTRHQRPLAVLAVVALLGWSLVFGRRLASDVALHRSWSTETAALALEDVDQSVRFDPTNPRPRLARGLHPMAPLETRIDDLQRVVRVRPDSFVVSQLGALQDRAAPRTTGENTGTNRF